MPNVRYHAFHHPYNPRVTLSPSLRGEEQAIKTWLQIFVNILKTTELHTLKGQILWIVNYNSIKNHFERLDEKRVCYR